MKEEHAEIDGVSIFTAPLPARRAARLKVRLLSIVAPLGDAAGGALVSQIIGAGRGIAAGEIVQLGSTLERILRMVGEDKLDSLLTEVLAGSHAEVESKRIWLGDGKGIDLVFTGRLATMYRVCAHALLVNYRDFFELASKWWTEWSARVEAQAATADPKEEQG